MLTLRTYFRPPPPSTASGTFGVRLGERVYRVVLAGGRAEVSAGGQPGQVEVDTDPDTFVAVLTGQLQLTDAVTTGRLRLDGDPSTLERVIAGRKWSSGAASSC
jgi:putative sterol carrier protein